METALLEILLNGNIGNTTTRRVSAAEVLVLRNIHGDDAVTNPSESSRSSRSNSDEVERLRGLYGKAAIEKVFPGVMPTLPNTFSSVGVEIASERSSRRQKAD